MNILNENEAIVINSLENWEKVAEILDKYNIHWENDKINEYTPPAKTNYICIYFNKNKLMWCYGRCMPDMIMIEDTEFIAKHSKNIFQKQMEAFYSQPLNQDKNMKIVVKKENFLIGLGEYTLEEYKEGFKIHPSWSEKVYKLENRDCANVMFESQYKELVRKGYIEEVKEVSYRFEDIAETIVCSPHLELEVDGCFSNEKQASQAEAFRRLTHVRAKILKDNGHSEDWEPEYNQDYSFVYFNIKENMFAVDTNSIKQHSVGLVLMFPNAQLAELALQHNQELFKTYLGV